MAPIRIHTSSPINANKGQTSDDSATREASEEGSILQQDATRTNDNRESPLYPPARPGASVPAPTGVPQPPAPHITPTRTTASNPYFPPSTSPPPPQPGAVPSLSSLTTSEAQKQSIPPPPKAGEAVHPASYYGPQPASPTTMPTQAARPPAPLPAHQQTGVISDPYRAQPYASTTSTLGSAGRPGDDAGGLNGPPGYVQNSASAFQDRPVEPYNPFAGVGRSMSSSNASGSVLSTGSGTGGGTGGGGSYASGLDDARDSLNGMWNTAVSWAKKAGEKLSEGEAEVWRRIGSGDK